MGRIFRASHTGTFRVSRLTDALRNWQGKATRSCVNIPMTGKIAAKASPIQSVFRKPPAICSRAQGRARPRRGPFACPAGRSAQQEHGQGHKRRGHHQPDNQQRHKGLHRRIEFQSEHPSPHDQPAVLIPRNAALGNNILQTQSLLTATACFSRGCTRNIPPSITAAASQTAGGNRSFRISMAQITPAAVTI